MKIFQKWFVVVILLIILLVIGENLRLSRIDAEINTQAVNPFANLAAKPKTGSVVPDFELTSTDGAHLTVKQFRGRAVVINFWATWCASCLVEMPLLQAAAGQNPDELVVLAVNVEENLEKVKPYLQQSAGGFHVLLDSEGKVANSFGVFGYPASFFVDKEGIIRYQQIGQMTETKLKENLKTIGIDAW